MAAAPDLRAASWTTSVQLNLAWVATTLGAKLIAFNSAASLIFDDNEPNDRPVGNWIVLLQATAASGTPGGYSIAQFDEACDRVARICMAGFLAVQTGRISSAKAAALLAAWNAQFST